LKWFQNSERIAQSFFEFVPWRFEMSDMDDEQIKSEIDGIMNGVKTIMQKIEDAMPKPETDPEQIKDNEENLDSSKDSTTN
jgi:hypothetical protein